MRRRAIHLSCGLVLLAVAGCAGGRTAQQAPPPAAPAWAMEGGNPSRDGRSAAPVPPRWSARRLCQLTPSYGFEGEEYSAPLLVGSTVYAGHSGRAVEARRADDGSKVWSAATRGRVQATAAYADGLLFVGDDEGYLVALRTDGTEAWKFRANYPLVTPPLAAAGKVYVAVSDQNVFCLEAATGRPIWQYGRKFPRKNSQWRTPFLAWYENRCYAGFADGTVAALDGEVGRLVWKADVAKDGLFGDIVSGPAVYDGRVFVGALQGPVVCLDAATGKELWRQDREVTSALAVGDGAVFVGTAAGKVAALSVSDGAKLWETPLDGGLATGPVYAVGGTVVVGASAGSLFALDAATGAVSGTLSLGSGIRAQPLVSPGGLFVLTNDGGLWLVEGQR